MFPRFRSPAPTDCASVSFPLPHLDTIANAACLLRLLVLLPLPNITHANVFPRFRRINIARGKRSRSGPTLPVQTTRAPPLIPVFAGCALSGVLQMRHGVYMHMPIYCPGFDALTSLVERVLGRPQSYPVTHQFSHVAMHARFISH